VRGIYLGDSYDIVKRFWSESLRAVAPLLAHPRFVPADIRMQYTSVTSIPVLDTDKSHCEGEHERQKEMTNEEMERGIEFLLKSQANFGAQLAQTSKQIETLVRTHTEFTQFARSNMEAQSELNQSLRETVRALTIAQARTDRRLGDLEGNNGKS
jgi:hypothetical protein